MPGDGTSGGFGACSFLLSEVYCGSAVSLCEGMKGFCGGHSS